MTEPEEELEVALDDFLEDWFLEVRSIKSYNRGVRIWCDYLVEDEAEAEDDSEDEEDQD